jgi:23S rRNA pseudouridine1911/1915/1917 synthase
MATPIPPTIEVPPRCNDMRLDACCSLLLEPYSRSFIQSCICNHFILLNGEYATKNTTTHTGDIITLDTRAIEEENDDTLRPREIPLEIVYEDEYLLAVNKQAGLAVHPHVGNRDHTLANALLHLRGDTLSNLSGNDRPGIVHRLDKNTSGILLVAKSNPVHTALKKMFSTRTIKKMYIGICLGSPPRPDDTLTHPIGRMPSYPTRRAVVPDGRSAITSYMQLAGIPGVSLMLFRIFTGRTHQIRVHAAYEGFPIAADKMYGGAAKRIGQLPPPARDVARHVLKRCPRLALHAYAIGLTHPVTNTPLILRAPVPRDMISGLHVIPDIADVLTLDHGLLYKDGLDIEALM